MFWPGEEVLTLLFVLMASYVDKGEVGRVKMLVKEAEDFQAQVTVTFYSDGGVKMCVALPSAKAC